MDKRQVVRIVKLSSIGIGTSALLCTMNEPSAGIRAVPLHLLHACIAVVTGLIINRTSKSVAFRITATTCLSLGVTTGVAGLQSLHASAPLDPASAMILFGMMALPVIELPTVLLTAFAVATKQK